MKPSLICILLFTALLPQMAFGTEKRQLEFHFPQQQQQQQQQFYGEIIDNNQQQQTVKLLPQSYPIQGIPIHRYDYFDADETAISGVEEQNPIVSGINFFKDEDLYPRTALVDFSSWTEWSFCSRSCGGGVSMRSRECQNQISNSPECNQDHEDQLFQYMICNIKPCPNADEDYRAIQCAEYNNTHKFGGIFENFSWIPYYGTDHEPCELRCIAIGYSFYKSFGPARDGTRCSQDRYDMCVGGKCMRVGCDRILGSNRTEDTCGVCGGDNSSCRLVRRDFTQTKNLVKSDYNEIAMIPKGATNIRVSETTGNYLALMEANGEFVNYVINGNWVINWPGDIPAAGTMVRYERVGEDESFFALGPTKTDLYVMMLYLGGKPKIELEYWLSNNDLSQRLHEFRRRFKIVPNEAFKTMPFIEPYSPPTTTPVPPPQVVPVIPVRTTTSTPTTTTTRRPRRTTTTTARATTTTAAARRFPHTSSWTYHHRPPPHNRPHHHLPSSSSSSSPHQPQQLPLAVPPLPVIDSPVAKVDRNRGKPPYCRPCRKTVGRKRHFCDSDFVIYVQILSKTRMEGKRYRHDVLVRKVYKSEFKLMEREYIWVYSSCCPRLRRGREYLIMGRKRRIKFNPGSRGSWITSEKKISAGIQFQTRLVLDYMDYWRTWKSRYDSKMSSLSQHQWQQCSKFKVTSKPKSRDPEKRSTPG